MNEAQWETAVLTSGANGEGNSMFYVPTKESALGVVVKKIWIAPSIQLRFLEWLEAHAFNE